MKEGASTLQMEVPKLRNFKEKWFCFLCAGRPDPPFDVTFVNHTHNSITLSWKPGFDGGSKQWFRVRIHGNIPCSITFIATRPYQLRMSMVKSGRVPTRTGKPGKMGRHFPVREKSGNFVQTGKVRENRTKYWKTQGI